MVSGTLRRCGRPLKSARAQTSSPASRIDAAGDGHVLCDVSAAAAEGGAAAGEDDRLAGGV